MAELELPRIVLPGAPLGSRPPSQPRSHNTTGRNTPAGGGHNAEEAIMIGSSDEEDEGPALPRLMPGPAIQEQRARLHRNRHGTPIPHAPENGLRIMSPPPPLPGLFHFGVFDHPGAPRPRLPDGHLHSARALGVLPHALRQLSRADRLQVVRMLHQDAPGIPLGSLMDLLAFPPPERPGAPAQAEYDLRMTHASAKPRIGYTFDFAPDEESEEAAAQTKPATPPPQVRTRTTIIIPDSPPARPVDHKGKGRARDEDLDQDEISLKEDPDAPIDLLSSPIGSPSSSQPSRKRRHQPEAVEIVEFLSDDESDDSPHASGSHASASASSSQAAYPEKIQTVLVCASCRRPLRTGGDRLWALRCGHMIDSRCYRRLAEGPVEDGEDRELVVLNAAEGLGEASSSAQDGRPPRKRRRTTRTPKGKGKGPAPPPVPQVIEKLVWKCPVPQCKRVHKSEHVMNGNESVWQPAKEDGPIKVFI